MSSSYSRRALAPSASRKRKEMEPFYAVKPVATPPPPPSQPAISGQRAAPPSNVASAATAEPIASNWLLAGFLAHEYLSKGTLFGQRWDPARAEAVPLSSAEVKKPRAGHGHSHGAELEPIPKEKPKPKPKPHQSYAEVACLLKGDGAHIPGIVNPTQLARWIQM